MKNFLLNNLLTIILIAAILIGGYFFYNLLQEKFRYQDNFEQLLQNNNSKILKLTKSEFKELQKIQNDSLVNMIMDSLKLGYRHIEKTITHNYHYTYDTTITKLIPTQNNDIYKFNHKFDNCLNVSGEVNWINKELKFNNAKINYKASSVYFWQRERKILWIIPFGRKQHFVSTKNNCTGKTTVEEIKIIKK